ncbi:MAG TPA: condensation domain-containing protein, partial [Chloroflexia bacterium]|nr:condensation domain-containing protein [Chloroflexia bacterium]
MRWRQWHEPLSEQMLEQACVSVDLRGVRAEELGEAVRQECERWQRSLELERGPLVRVVWMLTGEGGEPESAETDGAEPEGVEAAENVKHGRLLVVIHHLVVDGVSWRILVEDLERAYEQAKRGAEVELGVKTTSYRRWGEALREEAERGLSDEEVRYWEEVAEACGGGGLSDGAEDGREQNTEGAARSVEVGLSAEQTRRLLQEVPAAYNTRINDVLLTALARTLWWWRDRGGLGGLPCNAQSAQDASRPDDRESVQGDGVVVEMEGHGREEVGEALDLSRTVGWFTTIFPVLLTVPAAEGVGQTLKRVKEQLRAIPRGGLGYGLLRHLGGEQASERLRLMGAAQVGFNYLGQLDGLVGGAGRWLEVSGESAGSERDPNGARAHEVEVSGMVVRGELRMRWDYNGASYGAEEMEGVVGKYVAELEELIEHCIGEGAGGFTPSDFPLADLNQQALDRIATKDALISDIYSLAPLQHGLLFHSLYNPSSGEYIVQLTCTLHGDVDTEALEQAWGEVINRHAVLRTAFLWQNLKQPLQLVHRHVPLPWLSLDWRSHS